MLRKLKDELNKTNTENGANAYISTTDANLDFFSSIGAMRSSSDSEICAKFLRAYTNDSKLAIKTLFYGRDIRGGLGERNVFRVIMKYLANNYPTTAEKLLKLISEYGRYDDMLCLLDTPLKTSVIQLIKEQLHNDILSDKCSLLAKWLPSENASSTETKRYARILITEMGMTSKRYRKTLSSLRNRIKIVETNLSQKNYKPIVYENLPTKASMKYVKAFLRNDSLRYTIFISHVKSGEKKVNVTCAYPYEFYNKINSANSIQELDMIDVMWNNQPNYVKEGENALVVADVSGSMNGLPMSISVSLALYYAERNKGKFKNHFITFSANPQLIEIVGNNIAEKFRMIEKSEWEMNTDIEKVFEVILNTAVKNKCKKSELPTKLYIISDMQFDQSVRGSSLSILNEMKERYKAEDYKLPEIVYWNVRDTDNKPATKNEKGVQLVSGSSPVVFKQVVMGLTPIQMMMEILNKDRYKLIDEVLKC